MTRKGSEEEKEEREMEPEEGSEGEPSLSLSLPPPSLFLSPSPWLPPLFQLHPLSLSPSAPSQVPGAREEGGEGERAGREREEV